MIYQFMHSNFKYKDDHRTIKATKKKPNSKIINFLKKYFIKRETVRYDYLLLYVLRRYKLDQDLRRF